MKSASSGQDFQRQTVRVDSNSIRSSWTVFIASFNAFLLRELKHQYGRFRTGYFWALAEPAATVAVLTILHAFIRGERSALYGESPVIFFVFGAVPYFIFLGCVHSCQGVYVGSRGLFNYRQIKPIDIILARTVIEATTMASIGFLFLAVWWLLGNSFVLNDWLGLFFSLFSLFVFGLSVGLVFEVFGTVFPDAKRLFMISLRPMFFISGVFFTIEMIPQKYQGLLTWNPILHGVDLTRQAVLSGYNSPASFQYLWGANLIVLTIGLAAYRRYMARLI